MHVRSLLAGVGIAAVAATVPLVVVSTASAQGAPTSGGTTTATQNCPRLQVRQEVQSYLAAHPDLAQEIAALRTLPQDQRKQARQQYVQAHPDVVAEFKQLRQDRSGTWAEVAGERAAELDKYPAVQALFQDLAGTPAGQRAAEARKYLAAHTDARTQLQQLRADNRSRLQTCRAGG